MLDTLVSIINSYTSGLSRYKLYAVEIFRVDVEDIIYVVNTSIGDFAIYETDYIVLIDDLVINLKTVIEENNYEFNGIESLKLEKQASVIHVSDNKRYKYVLAKIKSNNKPLKRSNPTTYGDA
jgi:hypothetical protein